MNLLARKKKTAPDTDELASLKVSVAAMHRREYELTAQLNDLDMRFRQFVQATGIEIDKLKERA